MLPKTPHNPSNLFPAQIPYCQVSNSPLLVGFAELDMVRKTRAKAASWDTTERESLLAQTYNFMQVKVKALGHRKKPVKQVVSSGAHRQFHKFLSWFKVDGRIIANIIIY